MKDCLNTLLRMVEEASNSPLCACITDASMPPPCSLLQLFTCGMTATYMTTGLPLVSPHLMTPSCKQLHEVSSRLLMLACLMCMTCMSSPTPQTHSGLPWMCLIIWDNARPSTSVRCWCLGSDTTQLMSSTSIMLLVVWSWMITN